MCCLLGGSMVGLMATSSKRSYATGCVTQVCRTQSPCLCGRPLLTPASTEDTQIPRGRCGSVSVGSWVLLLTRFCWALQTSLAGMGFDSNRDFAPPTFLLSFALGHGISFFGGIQHSPVNGCSTVSCNFGVLVWEDERTSFYSAIWCVLRNMLLGFPHSSVSKESACNAGVPGSISGSGRSPGEGNGNLLQCYCLENPMDRGT